MIPKTDPLHDDVLAQRLSRIVVHAPAAPVVYADYRRRTRGMFGQRQAVTAVAALGTLIVLLTAAAYPGGLVGLSNDALRAAGLSSAVDVRPLTGSGEVAGIKVTVDGGYADRLDTVLFASIAPACQGPSCSSGLSEGPYLIDQYGVRYSITGGEGVGVGDYPMFFQPLSGEALRTGAKLTLHVPVYTAPLGKGSGEVVVKLSGTLSPLSARELALPAPIVDSRQSVTYEITELAVSANYLEVHTRLSGELQHVITHFGDGGEAWPGVYIVPSSGAWELPLAGGAGRPTINDKVQEESRIFPIHPGTYRIVVATSADQNNAPGPSWTVLAEWSVTVR